MKIDTIALLCALMLIVTSCGEYYKVIPHIRQYSPATSSVNILDYPPTNIGTYIGTIKIVPADGSRARKYGAQKAYDIIIKEAKAWGANYAYVRNFSRPQYDTRSAFGNFFERDFGEGTTLEIELYK